MVTEGLELTDEASGLAVRVDSSLIEVGAEVDETGRRIGEQVPGDNENGASHRDESASLASPADETPIALTEEGVRLR